jgi:hypothetical protein
LGILARLVEVVMVDRGGCTRNIRLSQVGLSSGCRVEEKEGRKKGGRKKITKERDQPVQDKEQVGLGNNLMVAQMEVG